MIAAIVLGLAVAFSAITLACVLVVERRRVRALRDRREGMAEREVAAYLRPHTGLVDVYPNAEGQGVE